MERPPVTGDIPESGASAEWKGRQLRAIFQKVVRVPNRKAASYGRYSGKWNERRTERPPVTGDIPESVLSAEQKGRQLRVTFQKVC